MDDVTSSLAGATVGQLVKDGMEELGKLDEQTLLISIISADCNVFRITTNNVDFELILLM